MNPAALASVLAVLALSETLDADSVFVKSQSGQVSEVASPQFRIESSSGGLFQKKSHSTREQDYLDFRRGATEIRIKLDEMIRLRRLGSAFEVTLPSGEVARFDGVVLERSSLYLRGVEIIAGRGGSFQVNVFSPGFVEMWHKAAEAKPASTLEPSANPAVHELTPGLVTALGLPTGTQGVLLDASFGELPAGAIIETVFHRVVDSQSALSKRLAESSPGDEVLVGYWHRGKSGAWERNYSFIKRDRAPAPPLAVDKLNAQQQESLSVVRASRDLLNRQLEETKKRGSSEQWSKERLTQELDATKKVVASTLDRSQLQSAMSALQSHYSKEFLKANEAVIRAATSRSRQESPLRVSTSAQVLIDQNEPVSTSEVGGQAAMIDSLAQEGIIDEDDARVARAAVTLIHALNGVQDFDTVLRVAAASKSALDERFGVKLENMSTPGVLLSTLSAGGRQLRFQITNRSKAESGE